MLTLLWNLSTAIRGYLRFYMPTNIAIDWLRTRRGLKWAVPVALVATPGYLLAMRLCTTIVADGSPGYLNVLVFLFAWNAIKFAMLAAVSPFLYARGRLRMLRGESPETQPTPPSPEPVRGRHDQTTQPADPAPGPP